MLDKQKRRKSWQSQILSRGHPLETFQTTPNKRNVFDFYHSVFFRLCVLYNFSLAMAENTGVSINISNTGDNTSNTLSITHEASVEAKKENKNENTKSIVKEKDETKKVDRKFTENENENDNESENSRSNEKDKKKQKNLKNDSNTGLNGSGLEMTQEVMEATRLMVERLGSDNAGTNADQKNMDPSFELREYHIH